MSRFAKALISPVGALFGLFDKPEQPAAPRVVPPSAPQQPSAIRDELTNRQGTRANQRSGGGGEPTSQKKRKLGA